METDPFANHKIGSAEMMSGENLLTEAENSHLNSSNSSKSFLEAEINRNQDAVIKDGGINKKENQPPQVLVYAPDELVAQDNNSEEQNNKTLHSNEGESDTNSNSTDNQNDWKGDKSSMKELSETSSLENERDKQKQANDEDSKIIDGLNESNLDLEKSGEKVTNEQMGNNDEEKDDEWLDILGSGQLKKKVLKKAENSYRPQRSHICEINVEGQLEDGSIVDKAEKLMIQIGDAEVVQGLDLALPLMDVGELALVQVGPRFAYGSLGHPPDVPPDATITYKVELLSAEPEPEIETLSVAQRKETGCRKRERGNWWYSRQEHTLAIQCYRRALEYLDDVEGGVTLNPKSETKEESDQLHDLLEERLKVYNNLAAAQLKIKAYDTALQSVGNVLRCQPNNVKALFRKAKILAAKGENAAAVENLRQASKLEPDSRMIKQELMRILSLHKEDTKHERNLYKKMLGQDKPAEHTKHNKFHIPWGILFGTVAAVVAGAVAVRYRFM